MKTSLPIQLISPALPACIDSAGDSLGLWVSDAPVGDVRRVAVRRRTMRIPNGWAAAAIRAYRDNAELA